MIYQFSNLVDDKKIDEQWGSLSSNEKARYVDCVVALEAIAHAQRDHDAQILADIGNLIRDHRVSEA